MWYKRSSSPTPAWHKRRAKSSFRLWDAWLREQYFLIFTRNSILFNCYKHFKKKKKQQTQKTRSFKLCCFCGLKKRVSKFLSNTPLYFQQTCCGWDMSPKRLWAQRFSYSLHSDMSMFFDIYFMNHNQPPSKCGFRMCCEKSLWQCNTISPLLSFPFLLSLLQSLLYLLSV